jgi:hypothetical protein
MAQREVNEAAVGGEGSSMSGGRCGIRRIAAEEAAERESRRREGRERGGRVKRRWLRNDTRTGRDGAVRVRHAQNNKAGDSRK